MRDEIIDFVEKWSKSTKVSRAQLLRYIGLSSGRYHDWVKRYGHENKHNGLIPRSHWLEDWERKAIVAYFHSHRTVGYRRLAYMMLDDDIVAVSPSAVYLVLKKEGLMGNREVVASSKGKGFVQPLVAHEHWHVDIAYINLAGTFYYICSVLDGYSRAIVHCEIREQMKEADVETIIQRALEANPGVRPRVISDNGPQFIARDFKDFVKFSGMTHVRTSPFYPQSNGKIERWHKTLKTECIRPKCPVDLADARDLVRKFVNEYNTERLHSGIGYITPAAKLEGRAPKIQADRKAKREEARRKRTLSKKVAA